MDKQSTSARKLRLAFAMFEAGVKIMRQNLIRRFPDAPPEIIERKLGIWLQTRDCAPHGDTIGRPVPLSRIETNSDE